MAFDEWLLSRVLNEPGLVCLRLYRWRPGAITFGYNQRQETALDFSRVGDTPVIRRLTGGRAIYHDPSEYTYAVALNSAGLENDMLVGSLSATSRALAGALALFLNMLGFEAELVRQSSRENARPDFFHKAPCFASRAKYELVSENRKIIASAQKRLGTSLLQHGSVKLNGLVSHPALNDGWLCPVSDKQTIVNKEFNEIAEIFRKAMASFLKFDVVAVDNSPEELEKIKKRCIFLKKNNLIQRRILNK
ncbi:MAG: lipoate--protein ligase family protein [candidate division Zixibacteria bacterium]|nr:lipoate--protein ligase family protein [candidate division Zixibacteria bacterium]